MFTSQVELIIGHFQSKVRMTYNPAQDYRLLNEFKLSSILMGLILMGLRLYTVLIEAIF